jgi:hypothetical protein
MGRLEASMHHGLSYRLRQDTPAQWPRRQEREGGKGRLSRVAGLTKSHRQAQQRLPARLAEGTGTPSNPAHISFTLPSHTLPILHEAAPFW